MQNGRAIPGSSRASLPFYLFILLILSALAAGCGGTVGTSSIANLHSIAIQGKVHGGEQPIVGAQVYFYAAGTTGTSSTGYGANATSLLNTPGYVTTLSDGSFSLTGNYDLSACQSAQDLVYVVAVGGNSGGMGNNAGTVLMSALGNCANLNTNTFVWVNEVTTVASVYALQQFMNTTAGNYNVGASSTNVTGLQNAFLAVTNLVNSSTGTALTKTPNGNGTVPQAEIDSLANIIAACVNSAGGSSVCNNLFLNATPPGGAAPADTLHAMLDIAQNPGNNVTALYQTPPPQVPFAPGLTAAPNDWTIAIPYTGGGIDGPLSLAVDASGNIWVVDHQGPGLSEFNTQGVSQQGSYGISSNLPNEPYALAIDPSGNLWVNSATSTSLIKFDSSGDYLTTATWGCSGGEQIATDSGGNLYGTYEGPICKYSASGTVTSHAFPCMDGVAVAVDGSGNVWMPNLLTRTVGEFDSSVDEISGEPSCGWSVSSGDQMFADAIDAQGDVWALNYDGGVAELSPSGASLGAYGAGEDASSIVIDGNDTVWTPCNIAPAGIDHLAHNGTPISSSNCYQASAVNELNYLAVDASGNIWATSSSATSCCGHLVEWVGVAAPVVTPLVQNLVNNPTTIGQRP